MTKIPNCLVNCFEQLHFCHYNLFRISDFVLLLLFVLGVLCVFARVIFFPIP